MNNLAGAYLAAGQYAKALPLFEESVRRFQAKLGAEHHDTLLGKNNLAWAYHTAGKLDGVLSTNMDALTIPAAGGRDTTVVEVGDYSNGNDGVVLKNAASLADIKGRPVNIVAEGGRPIPGLG